MKPLGRIIVILMGTLALDLYISISPASEHGNFNGLHQSEANKTHNEPLSLIHPESPRGVTGKTFH